MFSLFLEHRYSLVASGIRFKERDYATRADATQAMYKYCGLHNIKIKEIYDDKHYKTYICTNGIRFYIQKCL